MKLSLSMDLDPADIEAFKARVEVIVLKYGETPQPHLKNEFEEELKRAADALGRCVQVKTVVEDN